MKTSRQKWVTRLVTSRTEPEHLARAADAPRGQHEQVLVGVDEGELALGGRQVLVQRQLQHVTLVRERPVGDRLTGGGVQQLDHCRHSVRISRDATYPQKALPTPQRHHKSDNKYRHLPWL